MIGCDRCDAAAVWQVFSAYAVCDGFDNVHPRLARYPAPMFRLCSAHLPEYLRADEDSPGSSRMWVVTPA